MALEDDIRSKAFATFKDSWPERLGRAVPDGTTITQGNDAIHLEQATIAYADLDQSTILVDTKMWWFAASIYKTFLYAAARIFRSEGGTITAYDGDRVMAVFLGADQCKAAARAALKINWAVKMVVQPQLDERYKAYARYEIRHTVGIDVSEIRCAQAGTRGDTDLVWVGRAANHAAKLTTRDSAYSTWVTQAVFDKLDDNTRFYQANGFRYFVWTWFDAPEVPGGKAFGSTCYWKQL